MEIKLGICEGCEHLQIQILNAKIIISCDLDNEIRKEDCVDFKG